MREIGKRTEGGEWERESKQLCLFDGSLPSVPLSSSNSNHNLAVYSALLNIRLRTLECTHAKLISYIQNRAMIHKNMLTRAAHERYWRHMQERLERVSAIRDAPIRSTSPSVIPASTLYSEPGMQVKQDRVSKAKKSEGWEEVAKGGQVGSKGKDTSPYHVSSFHSS